MATSNRKTGAMHKFFDLLAGFGRDERGAFAAMFGLFAVVLIATAGATVDFTSVQNARTRAQVALDAAALALQPDVFKNNYTEEQARTRARDLMVNRIGDARIVADVTSAVASDDRTTLTLTAHLTVPLYFVSLIGMKEMSMTLVSQTTRGAQDLEVAVALDVTGSMLSNNKIGALISAANEMVDILVLDEQEPTYSKVALVPYSMGVNVGTHANAVRGTPIGANAVTMIAWANGAPKTVSTISKANPAVVTTPANHGLQTGDTVWISGITGSNATWQSLNNRRYTVTVTTAKKFRLDGTSTSGWTGSSTGGTVTECLTAACELVVTSANHPFTNGDYAFFTAVGGTTQVNSSASNIAAEIPQYFTAANVTTNSFTLSGTTGPNYSPYTSGGSAWCVEFGCRYYRFTSASTPSVINLHEISTCVTERTIAPYQYTDTAPATAPVGPNYPSSSNGCLTNQIVPLTSSKAALHTAINAFVAQGSTAGQIGTAWAWYMLAPSFASLWPTDSRPAAYNKPNLLKVMVLMTDGSFNSVYCNGVISADSTTGSGSNADHINCNAQNGNPFQQTKDLCDAMKSGTGILVYTVGFDIADQTNEKDMLSYCASDASKFKLANDAAALTQAFKEIAQDIAQLRLSE
jgi:Flp pilus assembly protein TadG